MSKALIQFLLLAILPLFFTDPNDGGGDGGANNGDGTGAEGSGAGQPATPPADTITTTTPPPSDVVSISREDFNRLASTVGDMATERANAAAEKDIVSRVPGFSLSAVHEHLKEMHKTDPAGAEALNNPKGWEMVFKAEIASKAPSPDAVNHGRNTRDDAGRAELASKLKSGEGSIEDRAEYFSKYL